MEERTNAASLDSELKNAKHTLLRNAPPSLQRFRGTERIERQHRQQDQKAVYISGWKHI